MRQIMCNGTIYSSYVDFLKNMEQLDALDSRKLLRFLHGNKTELSRLENTDLLLSKLRDCKLIPEDKYEEVRQIRKEAHKNKVVYNLLEWFENEKHQHIELFWKCVFHETLMEECPTLKRLHNKLMNDESNSCSSRNGFTPPSSPSGNLLQPPPLSAMRNTPGPSTRTIYLSLAIVTLLLHLLLALFCLSVLQTSCVVAPASSSRDCSSSDGLQQLSHQHVSGHPLLAVKKRDWAEDAVEELVSVEKVRETVEGPSKLEELFKHPLYNLPLPELQEDDLLLRLSEDDTSEEDSEGYSSSVEEGVYTLDWTSDFKTHPPWLRFHLSINRWQLYDRNDPNIAELSHNLATKRIIGAVQMKLGTQLKLIISFPNHGQALLKPIKQTRDAETNTNLFYFSDFDRHNAEVSAFHLDRALGFNRIPPIVGRVINVTTDVREITRDRKLAKTFFISPAGNVCFHGICDYYCNPEHPTCGQPHALEVSLAVMLPDSSIAPRRAWRSPWRRSYSRTKLAKWENNPDYCDTVKQTPPYNSGTRLLDVMDMVILDFLMSNMDRHHYETFETFGNNTFLLHLDNGRGFGRHSQDEPSILVPLQQCCRIRQSTLLRLELLSLPDFRLSDVMRESLSQDPLAVIAPLLTEPHLSALDRRLATVLQAVKTCQEHHKNVIFDDVRF